MSEMIQQLSQTTQDIPHRKYFTIGEVAKICNVKPHVLRYWEQEFPQLKPAKRRGNRRYYQYEDVILIKQIYELLYEKGYTINGARQWISQSNSASGEVRSRSKPALDLIQDTIYELESVLETLDN